jgi:hypothetical protein
VEKAFKLQPLTQRDARARTLDIALNRADVRTDAPARLPAPAFPAGTTMPTIAAEDLTSAARDHAPLSDNQRTFLALALACDLEVTDVNQHPALRDQYASITTQKQAADYIGGVYQKVHG